MKISEKQFKGKSFTFTIPYLGDIMARGEDPNAKKKFSVAGKEGLKITVNGIDISNEVYIDSDFTIKACDARYYHEVQKFFFANVSNVVLEATDSIKVTGFFEQSEIDYLDGSTGAPAWAAAAASGTYTFYINGGHKYHANYGGGSSAYYGELGRFYIEVYQDGALIDTYDAYTHNSGGANFGNMWGPIEVSDANNQVTIRMKKHANNLYGYDRWQYAGLSVLQDDQSTVIVNYANAVNWPNPPFNSSATAFTESNMNDKDLVVTLPF